MTAASPEQCFSKRPATCLRTSSEEQVGAGRWTEPIASSPTACLPSAEPGDREDADQCPQRGEGAGAEDETHKQTLSM